MTDPARFHLVHRDPDSGEERRFPYATRQEAVAQGAHDLKRRCSVSHVEDANGGRVVTLAQLRKAARA